VVVEAKFWPVAARPSIDLTIDGHPVVEDATGSHELIEGFMTAVWAKGIKHGHAKTSCLAFMRRVYKHAEERGLWIS
jgi:hypothetical protein